MSAVSKVIAVRAGERMLRLLPCALLLLCILPAQAATQGLHKHSSQATVVEALPVADGGALIGTAFREPDGGRSLPDSNTVRRLTPGGAAAWRYTAPQGYRVSLLDSTPNAGRALVKHVAIGGGAEMRLLLLDDRGQVSRDLGVFENTNWAWLSPDGRSVLCWAESARSIRLIDTVTGREVRSFSVPAPADGRSSCAIQPFWAGGCVLVADSSRGTVDALGLDGRPLWRVKGLAWRPVATVPVTTSDTGRWLCTKSARRSAPDSAADPNIEYYAYHGSERAHEVRLDDVRLMRIQMSTDSPGQQERADAVWARSTACDVITETAHPLRMGYSGGSLISADLLEDAGRLYLTTVNSTSVSALEFAADGELLRETPWPVQDVQSVYDAWLLRPDRLVIRRTKTADSAESVQIVDRSGAVRWELRPSAPVTTIAFTGDRRHMLISTSHDTYCCSMR